MAALASVSDRSETRHPQNKRQRPRHRGRGEVLWFPATLSRLQVSRDLDESRKSAVLLPAAWDLNPWPGTDLCLVHWSVKKINIMYFRKESN